MIVISRNTDPIPGNAVINPSTTRRRRGATDNTRKTRRIRSARKTDSPCTAGTSAMATTVKSKTFHPLRKNPTPRAMILSVISAMKMNRQTRSRNRISVPYFSIRAGAVSIPSRAALNTITLMMKLLTARPSTHLPRRSRMFTVPTIDLRYLRLRCTSGAVNCAASSTWEDQRN